MPDAARDSFHNILLQTVDTDLVDLVVVTTAKIDLHELWLAFWTGKQFLYIPVHEIAMSPGPDKSQGLCQIFTPTLGVTQFHHFIPDQEVSMRHAEGI